MKDDFDIPGRGATDEPGRDPRLAEALRALDPGATDSGYWPRFHRSVMEAAGDELARRRMVVDLTVGELLTSWSRTLVPAAVLAAAVAAFLLLEPGTGVGPAVGPLGLEEMLGEEFGGGAFASAPGDPVMDVTFASEGF